MVIELKFKVWDKKNKKICPVLAINFDDYMIDGGCDCADAGYSDPTVWRGVEIELPWGEEHRDFSEVILKQYIGKDKNGKEIYKRVYVK